MNIRIVMVAVWALLVVLSAAARAEGPPGNYIDIEHLDLVMFLPPPPEKGSKAEADDLAAVLKEQRAAARRR